MHKRGRKRKADPSKWLLNVAKQKRNLGQAYVSYQTKKVVPARKVGNSCNDDCFTKLGMDNVNQIFKAFWDIGVYDEQNQHLQSLIREVPIKRKRTKEAVSRRSTNYEYFVKLNQREFRVCRKAFLSIHRITSKKLAVLMHKRQTSPTGTPTHDQRGRKPCPRAIVGRPLEHVHEHISNLVVTASHYSRAHSPYRRYLESGLTIDDLHSNYVSWMEAMYLAKGV